MMSEFKEQLNYDLNNVFFNIAEFGDKHNYNGNEVTVIVDDDKLLEISLDKSEYSDGIFTGSKLIYLNESDVDTEPFVGQYVNFDNNTYCVKSVQTANGTYTIILGDNES